MGALFSLSRMREREREMTCVDLARLPVIARIMR
jgi:hypothetical protein